MHDASVDLLVRVFAPRNFVEMSRVLRPGGWFALVYPGANHLVEFRRRYRLLVQHKRKPGHYAEAVDRAVGTPSFTRVRPATPQLFGTVAPVCRAPPVSGQQIVRHTVLDADAVRDVVLMGPNARHPVVSTLAAETEPVAVTFDIALLHARKRGAPSVQGRAPRREGRTAFRAP